MWTELRVQCANHGAGNSDEIHKHAFMHRECHFT